MRAFVLHKPPGCITATRDFADRPTVYDHVPTHFPRLPHVGRLDWGTEGLLLFTDDGALTQGVLASGLPKVYRLKVRDLLDPTDPRIGLLQEPLTYRSGIVTRPAVARFIEHRARATWLEVTITEGRHRQVRGLAARSGFDLLKLRRVAIGPLALGDLRVRWCRPLTQGELAALYAAALPGSPVPTLAEIDDSDAARAARPPA